ncbi:MAG: TonB-dependent receptor [Burkholderiaceae bacterium]|nr:TonB-dependent receptor [Burkholderiaceae bacterium]
MQTLFMSRHALALAIVVMPAAVLAQAQHRYDIAAGPLDAALRSAAAQAGVALIFTAGQTAGLRSPGLQGNHTVEGAFEALLAGTSWQAVRQGSGYALRRVEQALPAPCTGTMLATVTVTAEAEGSATSEGTGSYAARGPSGTATRLALSLRETPQSVSVVTRQRMDDQGMDSLAEVLEQTPGLSVQNIGASRYTIYSRGYAIDNYQYDGIATATDVVTQNIPQTQSDLVIYDRVEVLRGAAGLLVGAGDPSGTINLVRKKPTRAFQGHAGVGLGSWGRRRGEIDVSGPLAEDGRGRGRFVAAAEQGGTHVQYYEEKKQTLYGVAEADLPDGSLLTAGLHYQNSNPRGGSGSGLPLFYSDGSPTHFSPSMNAGARWNTNRIEAYNLFATLEKPLPGDWTLKLSANHLRGKRSGASADASWGFPDRETGEGVMLYGGYSRAWQRQTGLDASVQGPLQLWGRRHEAVLGLNWAEYDNQHEPADDDIEGREVNIYRWNNETGLPVAAADKLMDYDTWQKQYGAYGVLRLKPRDDLSVILGARVSNYRYRLSTLYASAALAPRSSVVSMRESAAVTPYGGIVYDLNDTHSLYASYTSIFKPQSQRDRNGAVLDPREGDNYELGIKSEFLGGRLASSAALYWVRQDNLAEVDTGQTVPGTSPALAAYRAVKGARTQGLDFEVNGEIAPGWQVGASYNYNTTEDAGGQRIRTVFPRQMARLWTSYRFGGAFTGLTLGGGVNWQDRIYFTATPWQLGKAVTAEQKAYAVVNLMARYEFDRQWSATLNLNNLFNKQYLQGLDTTFYTGYYAATRNVTLNLKYRF